MNGFNLSAWSLSHRSFIIYWMIAVMVAGSAAFIHLGRNEDPPITIKTMIVHAVWPGATIEDTLQQVTERLERKVQEIPEVDFVRSQTNAGSTTLFVNLKDEVTSAQVPDIWYEVRKGIGDIRATLPSGVVGPFFNDDFGDTFGIIYGFTADGFTHRELRDYVESARSRLLQVPDVSKIELIGEQDEKIYVEFSTKQLAGLGIDRSALIAALRAQNVVSPAGVLETGDERIALRVTGAFESEQDLLDINFVSNGRLIRLRDIAEIHRGYANPPSPMFRVNGEPAIGLGISMREGGDILALGSNVRAAMKEITAELPLGIQPSLVADQAVVVDEAIGDFTTSLWQAIAIIAVVSFVSLGIRAGTVVALAIPISLAMVFVVMDVVGIDLQRISLGALIIALSLLVDDAMTTVDSMTTRLAAGETKEGAAAMTFQTLALPMLTGTLVTAAGFVPIGFARSSAGEYTFSIFAVVGIALIVSWLGAVIFSPLIGAALLKAPKPQDPNKPVKVNVIIRTFRAILVTAMRFRWITIGATLAAFVLAMLVLPYVPRQFFPTSDRTELLVDLRLPQNSSIFASEEASSRLDAFLKSDPDVERWSTYVGRGAIRFYLPLNVELANPFFSQAVVIAKDVEARMRLEKKLDTLLAEEFPSAVSNVSPLELGPPVGWPVQYRVSGPDINQVRDIALNLAQIVSQNSETERVNFDWMEPARMVRVRINQDQARLLGLSSQALAASLNAVVTGSTVTQVRDDIYLIDVIARATDEQRISLANLRTLQVPLPNGRTVPLSQVATFDFGQEYPLIWRRDREPTLTVLSAVKPGGSPEAIVQDLEPAVSKLIAGLPAGYRIAVGGTVEESASSQASVAAVVPFMLFLMVSFLMMQLQSFSRLALVLSVIPMGLIGVVGALFIFNRPLGFVAILGILSLLGLIAKNAVILLEQIETERRNGLKPWDAVVEATVSRFRPIILTAISTVLGMIPIAFTIFWGPMAFAIMGGLSVATLLTLIFLPALYTVFFRVRENDPAPKAGEAKAAAETPAPPAAATA
ncbi:efflux RND transporter permease subunit [Kaistia dalseonensis]|uniref:Multidrug efflux pump subunit AcrB n=1 Tax=Kaistia dalseonensis TaxID=410840 RepID=A0ABU0H820_9HYPH|nr:efflux RND transporter permease subunit [Kaistia dalseonensis]MCX5495856.1 efflux RND transporter permease subunit [Kaistia dalseonensis]MDQ0438457.1 multidrug efflux pump subunit AcrB [Kaistia dalseonensis]